MRFVFLLLVIMLAGCSNAYKDSLERGKSLLKENKYEEASKEFRNALIEKPNDSDATALMTMATDNIKKENSKLEFDKYRLANAENFKKFVELVSQEKDVSLITVESITNKVDSLLKLKTDVAFLGGQYASNQEITQVHNLLLNSIDEAVKGNKTAISLLSISGKEASKSRIDSLMATLQESNTKYKALLSEYTTKVAEKSGILNK